MRKRLSQVKSPHLVSCEEGAGGVVLSDKGDADRGPEAVLHLVVAQLRHYHEERGDGDGQSDLHGLGVGHQQRPPRRRRW